MTGMFLRQSMRPPLSFNTTDKTSRSPAAGSAGQFESKLSPAARGEIERSLMPRWPVTSRTTRSTATLGRSAPPVDRGEIERCGLLRTEQQPARRQQDGPQIHRVDDRVGPRDRVGLDRWELNRLAYQLDWFGDVRMLFQVNGGEDKSSMRNIGPQE